MVNWVKTVKYMVMEGNQTFDGEHIIQHTDIELQYTCEILYI